MNADFISALEQIEAEKGISKQILLEAVESSLVNAYKKNFGATNNVTVSIDKVNGDIKVLSRKKVVNKREIDLLDGEISLEGAQEIDSNYKVDDIVEEEVTPRSFGRIAAQTARQMVVQKIKEASRDIAFVEFSNRINDILVGEVGRKSKSNDGTRSNIYVTLNVVTEYGIVVTEEALLPAQEQIPGEEYEVGSRISVLVLEVKKTNNVPQIFLSRSHPGLIKRLFEREVPEISEGIVQIKSISREAGSRSKIAVVSVDPDIDAIGACVGESGMRVAGIVDDLKGEKIDIIQYSDDSVEYISNALSPSKVISVEILENKSAQVIVPDNQLSLAIGKEGQNVRLAARLTGWKIDIKSEVQKLEDDSYGSDISPEDFIGNYDWEEDSQENDEV